MLRNWKESIHLQWEAGALQGETIEETALANASALGSLDVLKSLLELEFDKFEEFLNDA